MVNAGIDIGSCTIKLVLLKDGHILRTEGPPVLDLMEQFVARGSKIFSCGTCLDYCGRKDRLVAGEPTNMRDTVAALLSFNKVLQI